MKKIVVLIMVSILVLSVIGCGKIVENVGEKDDLASEKVFNYGTTAYGEAMGNAGLDPHNGYMGWSTIRYGVGETLFKFNENMEVEPWLASDYQQIDEYTLQINLRDDVTFSNGKKMTGDSVKKSLERLVENHDRAPVDLDIKEITAKEQSITIVSNIKVPAMINYLCDPYGAIIDVEAGVDESYNVVGTGPYKAENVKPTEINLLANDSYWGGKVNVDRVNVISITDGDTLTMALQSGEIDATQGLPYASLQLFEKDNQYKISSNNTSRVYMAAFNFKTIEMQELKVREAIAMGIDKKGFTEVLLNGNGVPAVGPFPSNFVFGNNAVSAPSFDIEKGKELLAEAGWKDTDGDGYVDKEGEPLIIRWLTYTSRQELPLLAETAQATLKDMGVKVEINATDNYKDFLQKGEYDIYASAFVAAPTGDPQYYFTTHLLDDSAYNRGFYHSDRVEELVKELRNEFDIKKRSELAVEIQQEVLDDSAYIYASHLKMCFVMDSNVTGFEAHPSDYYEITVDLDIK